jgi:hypothetical protein
MPLTAHRAPESFKCLFVSKDAIGWDIYQTPSGELRSLSTTDNTGKGDSRYGRIDNVFRLMSKGCFDLPATDDGLEAISGACSSLPTDYFDRVSHYKKMRSISKHYWFKVHKSPPAYVLPKVVEH